MPVAIYYLLLKHFEDKSFSSSSQHSELVVFVLFLPTKLNITYFFSVGSVLKTVQGCGDYDRLAQGVFENYLNMKIKDSSMVSVSIFYMVKF